MYLDALTCSHMDIHTHPPTLPHTQIMRPSLLTHTHTYSSPHTHCHPHMLCGDELARPTGPLLLTGTCTHTYACTHAFCLSPPLPGLCVFFSSPYRQNFSQCPPHTSLLLDSMIPSRTTVLQPVCSHFSHVHAPRTLHARVHDMIQCRHRHACLHLCTPPICTHLSAHTPGCTLCC